MEKRIRGPLALFRDLAVSISMAGGALHTFNDILFGWQANIMNANAELEKMQVLFRGMSSAKTFNGQIQESAEKVDFLVKSAQELPFTIKGIADSMIKLQSVDIDPTAGSFKSLANAVASFGGTDETLHRASIAIQQMAGKGVISMEELRQQLGEAVPSAFKLLARSMKMTTQEMVDLISQGKVKARPALERLFDEFQRTFEGRGEDLMSTWNGLVQRLSTQWFLFKTKIGEQGYFDEVKFQLEELVMYMTEGRMDDWAKALGESMTNMVIFIRQDLIPTFREFSDEIRAAGIALAAVFGARTLISIIRMVKNFAMSMVGAYTAIKTAGAAATTAGVAFRAMLGPIGAITTALAAATAGFSDYFDSKQRAVAGAMSKSGGFTDEDISAVRAGIEEARAEIAEMKAEYADIFEDGVFNFGEDLNGLPELEYLFGNLNQGAAEINNSLMHGFAALGEALMFDSDEAVKHLQIAANSLSRIGISYEEFSDQIKATYAEKEEALKTLEAESKRIEAIFEDERISKQIRVASKNVSRSVRQFSSDYSLAVAGLHKQLDDGEISNEEYNKGYLKETEGYYQKRLDAYKRFSDALLLLKEKGSREQKKFAEKMLVGDKGNNGFLAEINALRKEQERAVERAKQEAVLMEKKSALLTKLERKYADVRGRLAELNAEQATAGRGDAVKFYQKALMGFQNTDDNDIAAQIKEANEQIRVSLGSQADLFSANVDQVKSILGESYTSELSTLKNTIDALKDLSAELERIKVEKKQQEILGSLENKLAAINAQRKHSQDLISGEFDMDLAGVAEAKAMVASSQAKLAKIGKSDRGMGEILISQAERSAVLKYFADLKQSSNDAALSIGNDHQVVARSFASEVKTIKRHLDLLMEADAEARAIGRSATDLVSKDAYQTMIQPILDGNKDLEASMMDYRDSAAATYRAEVEDMERLKQAYAELAEAGLLSGEQRALAEEAVAERVRLAHKRMVKDAMTPMQRLNSEWQDSTKQMRNSFVTMAETATDAMLSFTGKSKNSFRDMIETMLYEMARVKIQKNLMGPLFESAEGFFMGGQSTQWNEENLAFESGGGFFDGLLDFLPFANGGIMTNKGKLALQAYSNGGIANKPQLALFGEGRQPEAYVPLPDGKTIPVTLKGGMSANNVEVNVINQTSQPVTAQQGAPKFDGEKMILDVVLKGVKTPGPFRDNMKGAML